MSKGWKIIRWRASFWFALSASGGRIYRKTPGPQNLRWLSYSHIGGLARFKDWRAGSLRIDLKAAFC
jgi:hypothetical protein